MIGMDWGVNFCVAGIDRNWAYQSGVPGGGALSGCSSAFGADLPLIA